MLAIQESAGAGVTTAAQARPDEGAKALAWFASETCSAAAALAALEVAETNEYGLYVQYAQVAFGSKKANVPHSCTCAQGESVPKDLASASFELATSIACW